MKTPISKSVLAIVMVGVILIAGLVWLRLNPRRPTAAEAAPAIAEAAPAPTAPAPKAAPAKPAAIAEVKNSNLPVIPISLTNLLGSDEAYAGSGMGALPTGTQVYGGIEFWLQGIVRLQGLATRDEEKSNFRTSIEISLDETNFADGKVSINERGLGIACIYFLGGTLYNSERSSEKIADVVWHYADGTAARSPLEANRHVRDWVRKRYEQPAQLPNPGTKVAWNGAHPQRKDISIRLYRVALVNPHPDKTIRTLEFASAMARPSLFISALTLDPLMPGMRPDNLSSAEMADPELNGQMMVTVQDGEGHALPDAEITTKFKSATVEANGQKVRTDNNGMALVRYMDEGLQTLDISATHDDYSSRRMLWDVKAGDTVPASYTLKLATDVKVGGIVYDPENNPIVGATVTLYRVWSGSERIDQKGDQVAFNRQTMTTDGEGRWQAKGLPLELLGRIYVEAKHPDYIPKTYVVGENAVSEKQLREGTHKAVLQRGLDVRGRVLDTSDIPISGATVWTGERYSSLLRKQTTSDDQGRFSFHNVKDGDVLFSVMAKGRSPDYKTIPVQANMGEIVFRLKAGSVIRGHVQDESSQPLAGVRVNLSGNYGQPWYNIYEFSGTTDSNGDFSWDSAPDEPMPFSVSKTGYESKNDVKLTPNQDNIIKLRKTRTLSGLVLDATTEQPITNFTVRTGTASGDNANVYGVVRYKDFTAADGRFTLNLTEESDNAVAVYAEDYADTIEKFPEAQDGNVSVVARLKPSTSLSGVVLAPDGTPAPGVSVAIASEKPRTSIQLIGGRMRSYDARTKTAVTDGQGHFKVSVPAVDGTVLAIGDPGFASAPVATVRSSGIVNLQAWGRIEGTLKIGGQPGVGKDVLYTLSVPGATSDFNGYKATTDEQGKFTMEKIPAGEGAIVRLVKTSASSWTHSDSTTIMVKSGETTQVSLGDNGAVIVGNIRYDNPPTNPAALAIQGGLSLALPNMPKFTSPAEAQAFYSSPEWRAMMKLQKHYSIEIKPDGTFMADNVVPGDYTLNVTARMGGDRSFQNPPLAQGSIPVTVPDSFNPASPIDVGEITLNPVQNRQTHTIRTEPVVH